MHSTHPQHLNVEEIRMINHIFAREIQALALDQTRSHWYKPDCSSSGWARRRRRYQQSLVFFTWLTLTLACTKAIPSPLPPPPPPAPYTCAIRPIQVMAVQSLDANGNPVEGPAMALDTAICACSDGVIRLCGH